MWLEQKKGPNDSRCSAREGTQGNGSITEGAGLEKEIMDGVLVKNGGGYEC